MAPPSEKDTKFDRQLRLWGADGQTLLEEAHVGLVGATTVGCELLKDLILPNIGQFTIIDDQLVKEEDVATNFFVESDSLNQPRAEITTQLLNELNEDVKGHFVTKSVDELVESKDFWKQFTVVVASDVKPSSLVILSSTLYELNIPLVIIESISFFGSLLISLKEHTIIESHPSSFVDLRLDRPWKELREYANQTDLEQLDDIEIAHVPYIILLLKYLDIWKWKHDGKLPKTSAEKREFKKLIQSGKRPGVDCENFNEAVSSSWRLFTDSSVPHDITSIVNDKKATIEYLSHNSSSAFWILVAALGKFIQLPESNNTLPATGVLPDMTADTTGFVGMQQVYREKAKKDIATFTTILHTILQKIGKPTDSISEEQIATFCKNSRNLKIVRGRSLEQIFKEGTSIDADAEGNECFSVFLGIETAKHFREKFGRYLGRTSDAQLPEDYEAARKIQNEIVSKFGVSAASDETFKVVEEIARVGSYELHNLSSLLGGIGSQEVVKIITHQYTLLDNLLAYNGVSSKGQSWKI